MKSFWAINENATFQVGPRVSSKLHRALTSVSPK